MIKIHLNNSNAVDIWFESGRPRGLIVWIQLEHSTSWIHWIYCKSWIAFGSSKEGYGNMVETGFLIILSAVSLYSTNSSSTQYQGGINGTVRARHFWFHSIQHKDLGKTSFYFSHIVQRYIRESKSKPIHQRSSNYQLQAWWVFHWRRNFFPPSKCCTKHTITSSSWNVPRCKSSWNSRPDEKIKKKLQPKCNIIMYKRVFHPLASSKILQNLLVVVRIH